MAACTVGDGRGWEKVHRRLRTAVTPPPCPCFPMRLFSLLLCPPFTHRINMASVSAATEAAERRALIPTSLGRMTVMWVGSAAARSPSCARQQRGRMVQEEAKGRGGGSEEGERIHSCQIPLL